MKLLRSFSSSSGLNIFSIPQVFANKVGAGFTGRVASTVGTSAALLLVTTAAPCHADETSATGSGNSSPSSPLADYFSNWFARVSKTQAEQPHWITPVTTVTPRLEEELRYDQMWEAGVEGHTLTNYGGGGGKGLELIPAEHIELIIGIPSWQTQNTSPHKDGWTDESFLIKYRLLSANEEEGNYILTAFMGITVPNGSDNTSSHHFAYSPTIAFGKGCGDFDFQSTVGVSVPENGGERTGTGTPVLFNTALQYRVMKYFWPEVEANYTYWPNGKHEGLNQLFLTPGLVIGRIPIAGRLGLTVGAGYQRAVTDRPLYHQNVILTARLPF